MKSFLFILCLFLCLYVSAQDNAGSIFGSGESSDITLLSPTSRDIQGGTVINVDYVGNQWNCTRKGAFEYACRIWEENMPTALPVKLRVSFASISNVSCLATVNLKDSGFENEMYEKVLVKRLGLTYGFDYFSNKWRDLITLDYLKNDVDADIVFSSKNIFEYSLEKTLTNKNKYDFVTVALQAIGKALGFTLKAYGNNTARTLIVLNPCNQYTRKMLQSGAEAGVLNYKKATTGNPYFSSGHANGKEWHLYVPSTFEAGRSLEFFKKEPTNRETLLMQPDIPKGAVIRYIGQCMWDFFSFVGWDRPMYTGIGGGTNEYISANTSNVLPFRTSKTSVPKFAVARSEEDLDSYISNREEAQGDGNYILRKDGSWKSLGNGSISDLTIDASGNDEYARTSDGYLRLKNVLWIQYPGFNYSNVTVRHYLSDYIPQKAKASLNSVVTSAFNLSRISKRTYNLLDVQEDEYVDVEIGFQNTEGCTSILVEQKDEDYDMPYSYEADPKKGSFTAYMNKKYQSTFKLIYKNKNGQVIGDPLIVNLKNRLIIDRKLHLELVDNLELKLKLVDDSGNYENLNCNYSIYDVNKLSVVRNGLVNDGVINIEELPSGIYTISLVNHAKVYSMKFVKK